jgi:hypothetical protein
LRIGHTARSPENTQKLVALPVDAAEQTEFLQNHSPGDDGKKEKQCQYGAGNPTGLFKDAAEVSGKRCNQEKRNVGSSV